MNHLHDHSFPPVVSPATRTLILGSLPGAESLRQQQYYAHPRNRFWHIISSIAGQPLPDTYAGKITLLTGLGLGLWDIAARAIRPGSLDSNITDVTPNDIPALLRTHPGIRTVIFNGRKAQDLFHRHFSENGNLRYIYLPGTSPANAGYSADRLLAAWRAAIQP